MFLPLTGLSVFIHLAVIFTAMVVNRVRGRGLRSAYQTYNKHGGVMRSRVGNRFISILVIGFVLVYMVVLASVAIITAVRIGIDEPQRQLYLAIFAALLSHMGSLIVASIVLLTGFTVHVTHPGLLSGVPVKIAARIAAAIDSVYESVLRISMSVFHPYNSLFAPHGRYQLAKSAVGNASLHTAHENTFPLMRRFLLSVPVLIVAVAALLGAVTPAHAQIVEPGFESEVVVENLSLATALAFAPDGRIFIAEKGGAIKLVKDGVLQADPLVILTDVNTFGDRGLLGLAVDPNFAENGYIYVSYTYENTPGSNIAGPKTGRIVRLTVEGDSASESSKVVLVGSVGGSAAAPSCQDVAVTDDCIPSDSNSHSVGGLRFGPDGKLYATLGDGADFVTVDPRALRAQNVDSLAGKLLRINTDGTAPADNPFYNGSPTANRSKVYALGLRNAFRLNFHPTTNQLYVGDVGWGNWEEINRIVPGGNYGWPCREGNSATTYGCAPSSTTTNPLYAYAHNSAGAGSITGGAFPKSGAYPASFNNSLFIGDYAQMWMKRLNLNAAGTSVVSVNDFNTGVFPVDIVTGPDGNLYYIDIVFGTLNRLTHTSGNRRPTVQMNASPSSGLTPLSVVFSSAGSSDPDGNPISYAWSFGDGATSTLANPSHVYTTNGEFNASLTVTDSLGSAVSKSISIVAGNQKPTATITSPASGSLYGVGEQITVTGIGMDPEQGALSADRLSWTVILHHNTHTHTIYQASATSSITFPADDHDASDVYLEIILTVTDSSGLADSESINMYLNNGAGAGNLVSNPSMEIEGGIAGSPHDWYQSWYGVMNPSYTYPVAGLAGEKAGRITVSGYQSGSAKWLFSPTFVTVGKEYTFSNLYTATVPTEVTVQYGMSDGTFQYVFLAIAPARSTTTRQTHTFTVPPGAESATVFHELTSNGTLTVDDYSLTLAGGDGIAPTGSIASPAASSTLSGTVSVAVNASDNVGVASTQLVVDGVPVGVADSEPPYANMLDTTALSNGTHTLFARILDTSGNVGDTAAITIIVSNASSTPINLFENGNFETAGTNGNPAGWTPGGWGTHTAQYSYPVAGFTGSAVQILVTDYGLDDTGDARWINAPVALTQGTRYTYSTMYKATTITDVLCRYRFGNGSEHFFGLIKEIPPSATWKHIENSFVPPVGAVDVTCGHAISAETHSLAIDDVALYANGTGTPSEINVPKVAFVSPTAGATLSGSVTLTASSSDDTAVVGVFFAINGSPIGIEDLTAPYQAVLDTTTYPNGSYLLKATTRDPYGNNDNVTITVTINNSTTTPPATNLVANPGLETAGTGGNPASWNRNAWGTNTATFTYPVAGQTGNGARVAITGYSSGDAKWYFNDIAVTPGTGYTASDRYNSNISSQVVARYTQANGTLSYVLLDTLPATGGAWQAYSRSFTPPANTTSMTLFHLIAGNGTLTIDDMSVVGPGSSTTTPDTTTPTVSITAPAAGATISGVTTITASASDNVGVAGVTFLVDGAAVGGEDTTAPYSFAWNSASTTNGSHTITARARDAAGNVATSSAITVTVNNSTTTPPATNLVANPGLETAGTGGNPSKWNRGGWGTNTIAYAYPVAGVTGNGAAVTVTNYTNGDAKWFFDPVAVTPGTPYTVGDRYKSTLASVTVVRYTQTNGSFTYVTLDTLASTGGNWQTYSKSVTPPSGVTHLTLFHVIAGNGTLTIDDASVTGPGGATSTPDTTLPTVSVTAPATGATVSGNVSVAANASDNVGVAAVEFSITTSTTTLALGEDTSAPYSYVWQTVSVPNGSYTINAVARDASGNRSATSSVPVTVQNATSTPDTTVPTVSVTAPAAGATISGTTTLTASASDNVGVVGVTFLVDGVAVGGEDTTAPYNLAWNSASVANGSHTITARARDAAGNLATSSAIVVTINNSTTTPPATNLVTNPGLETAGTGGNPANWNRGGWGTNTHTYAYPVAGQIGNGAEVTITSYTNGDTKWYFDSVAVTSGKTYVVGDSYRSTVASEAIVRYTLTNGNFQYVYLQTLPSTNGAWQTFSTPVTVPANVTGLSLFHVIAAVGTLAVDNAVVAEQQ